MTIVWTIVIVLLIVWIIRVFHTTAARINSANQDYTKALAHWEAAYQKKPDPNKGTQYGYLLLRSGKFEQAEQVFEEILEMDKLTEQTRLQTEMMLGLVAWKKGNLDEAIGVYENLHSRGENTVVYANLGFLYLLRDSGEDVLPFLQQAYEYNDTNPAIIDNLAEWYCKNGDWEKGEELLEKAVRLPRPIAENYYHYAILLEHKKEWEAALSYYQKAETMDLNVLSGLDKQEIQQRICRLKEIIENEEE